LVVRHSLATFIKEIENMSRLVLITGGTRSGKSEYARVTAESLPGPRAFVATCLAIDDEMRRRIEKHQESRPKSFWETIEEPFELAAILRDQRQFNVFLIDCLTLWLNNHLYRAREQGQTLSENQVAVMAENLIEACSSISGSAFLVTNEVGSGIVPEHQDARLFRDLMGICNQLVARAADEVVLVTCGLPLKLKNGGII
jgi:adenosylcobinamide kinase/adenosylcobinamide-phosphate guanylyltransferase